MYYPMPSTLESNGKSEILLGRIAMPVSEQPPLETFGNLKKVPRYLLRLFMDAA